MVSKAVLVLKQLVARVLPLVVTDQIDLARALLAPEEASFCEQRRRMLEQLAPRLLAGSM